MFSNNLSVNFFSNISSRDLLLLLIVSFCFLNFTFSVTSDILQRHTSAPFSAKAQTRPMEGRSLTFG